MPKRNCTLLFAALCASLLVTPVHAQWRDPSANSAVSGAAPAGHASGEAAKLLPARPEFAMRRTDVSALIPPSRARMTGRRGALLGAGVGAGAGIAAFLLASDGCWRRAESMCELAIPIYVGAGAAVGGLVGLLLGD
jgi:hypothetical protein